MKLSILSFLLCQFILLGAEKSPRPNILYFYVDDMGWGSIGPNGQEARRKAGLPAVLTPNLDLMAKEGVNFQRGYGAPICSPARSVQQTGFHQGHAFADWNNPDNAKKAIRAEDLTMGDVLSKAGYVTGYWGKWGYGGSKDQNDPVIQNIQTLPTSHGYQHVVAELHHVRAHTFFQPTLWSAPASNKLPGSIELVPNNLDAYKDLISKEASYSFLRDNSYPEVSYCDDHYALAVLKFVKDQSLNYNKTGQPFFGLFAAQIPHAPFGEISKLPEWDEAYKSDKHFSKLKDQSKQWAAMVTRIDQHIGVILNALKDPNGDGDYSDSVEKNTLVIFQSDNGGPRGACREEYDSNGGLKGSKGSVDEGGIRVPTIMKWPAQIHKESRLKVGSNERKPFCVSNLLPTFSELAGEKVPLGLDGVSLAPTLTNKGFQREREFLIHETPGTGSIIKGDYKLLINSKKSKSKKIKPSAKVQLYNLRVDKAESNNLVNSNPKLTTELTKLLKDERVGEPGFSNTYHQWLGSDGAEVKVESNWSQYEYKNAGITYQKTSGHPVVSWTALMKNNGMKATKAIVKKNVSFLALEIEGEQAEQQLYVKEGVVLNGRNEIRISNKGRVKLEGGTLDSMRWVEIQNGAVLEGKGDIRTNIYNSGTLVLTGSMNVEKSLYLEEGSSLSFDKYGVLDVNEKVELSGSLEITSMKLEKGESKTLIKTKLIKGKFSNKNQKVKGSEGELYQIHTSNQKVWITR